jgi:hypothetical protein
MDTLLEKKSFIYDVNFESSTMQWIIYPNKNFKKKPSWLLLSSKGLKQFNKNENYELWKLLLLYLQGRITKDKETYGISDESF